MDLHPFIKPLGMEDKLREFLKDMFTRERGVYHSLIIFSELCDVQLMYQAEVKQSEPEAFHIACSIGSTRFTRALCDLGSNVSLIPEDLARVLGLDKYMEQNDIIIHLADTSRCVPEGLLKDIPVQVGDHFILTDFYVMKSNPDVTYSLLLGRPFLAGAGAVINVKERSIVFNFETESVEMRMDQPGILFTTEIDTENKPSPKKRKITTIPHREDASI